MSEPGDLYRLTHNTLREAVRIIVVECASILFSALTIPYRVARRKKAPGGEAGGLSVGNKNSG